jgi:hypothetical protein
MQNESWTEGTRELRRPFPTLSDTSLTSESFLIAQELLLQISLFRLAFFPHIIFQFVSRRAMPVASSHCSFFSIGNNHFDFFAPTSANKFHQ